MTSSNPPKQRRTVKLDVAEVAKLAAESRPCPDCAEILPIVEELRMHLQQERQARTRLEGAITSALQQVDELRTQLREHAP